MQPNNKNMICQVGTVVIIHIATVHSLRNCAWRHFVFVQTSAIFSSECFRVFPADAELGMEWEAAGYGAYNNVHTQGVKHTFFCMFLHSIVGLIDMVGYGVY